MKVKYSGGTSGNTKGKKKDPYAGLSESQKKSAVAQAEKRKKEMAILKERYPDASQKELDRLHRGVKANVNYYSRTTKSPSFKEVVNTTPKTGVTSVKKNK